MKGRRNVRWWMERIVLFEIISSMNIFNSWWDGLTGRQTFNGKEQDEIIDSIRTLGR